MTSCSGVSGEWTGEYSSADWPFSTGKLASSSITSASVVGSARSVWFCRCVTIWILHGGQQSYSDQISLYIANYVIITLLYHEIIVYMECVLANSLSGSQVYRWALKEDSGNSRPNLRNCSNGLSSCETSKKLSKYRIRTEKLFATLATLGDSHCHTVAPTQNAYLPGPAPMQAPWGWLQVELECT